MKGLFAFEAEPFEFEAYGGSESEFTFRPEPFPWPSESEWEGEASRSSPDYIRWVQSSLNRVMGLRLAVDGILGPVTRSAVRNFQQRKGLAVDGIVGPKTEAALVAAGAPRPPAAVSATAAGGGSPPNIPTQCSAISRTNCHVLYFGFDKDVPTPPVPNRPARTDRDAHEEKLFEIAERVVHSWETSQPVNSLLVLGHASPEGTDVYNYDLAMRRAENVSEALAEQVEELEPGGGSRIDLQVESCGEKPIGGLSVEEQRQVEVCFRQPPHWFETGGRPPTRMQPVWLGNDVRFFIDGATTFAQMVSRHQDGKVSWPLHLPVGLVVARRLRADPGRSRLDGPQAFCRGEHERRSGPGHAVGPEEQLSRTRPRMSRTPARSCTSMSGCQPARPSSTAAR